MLAGIPSLDLLVDMSHCGEVHHKSSDTFDKVDPINLKADATVVTVTALCDRRFAEADRGRHRCRRCCEIVKDAGLETLMESIGAWREDSARSGRSQ